jgi:hypothetical protein
LLNVRINLNEECEDSFHRRYSPFLLLVRNGAAQAFVKLISVRIPPVFAPSMEPRLGKQGDGVFLNVIYLKGPKRKFTRPFMGGGQAIFTFFQDVTTPHIGGYPTTSENSFLL